VTSKAGSCATFAMGIAMRKQGMKKAMFDDSAKARFPAEPCWDLCGSKTGAQSGWKPSLIVVLGVAAPGSEWSHEAVSLVRFGCR
jgi:hypothetical protein